MNTHQNKSKQVKNSSLGHGDNTKEFKELFSVEIKEFSPLEDGGQELSLKDLVEIQRGEAAFIIMRHLSLYLAIHLLDRDVSEESAESVADELYKAIKPYLQEISFVHMNMANQFLYLYAKNNCESGVYYTEWDWFMLIFVVEDGNLTIRYGFNVTKMVEDMKKDLASIGEVLVSKFGHHEA